MPCRFASVPNMLFKLAHDPDSVAARDANLRLIWRIARIGEHHDSVPAVVLGPSIHRLYFVIFWEHVAFLGEAYATWLGRSQHCMFIHGSESFVSSERYAAYDQEANGTISSSRHVSSPFGWWAGSSVRLAQHRPALALPMHSAS
jgi:hypothetical protein